VVFLGFGRWVRIAAEGSGDVFHFVKRRTSSPFHAHVGCRLIAVVQFAEDPSKIMLLLL
jgi:hypothetical protein